jgi:3-oxoacyl-[acyl-carrier protein] reductase
MSDETGPLTSSAAFPFQDMVALVTGGSRGIGAATARVLAAQGAAVAVNYHRSGEKAEEVAKAIVNAGGRAIAIPADVTDEQQVQEMVKRVEHELGDIDVLVLNAFGVQSLRIAPVLELTATEISEVVQAQLAAFLHPVYAVAPGMVSRGRGSIVAIGAAASRRPSANFATIGMAKAALDVGIRILAQELGPHGVRVNAVAPGLILTGAGNNNMPEAARAAVAQRAAVRRNGVPEDIAELVAFLASPRSAYVTGTYLMADGGTSML